MRPSLIPDGLVPAFARRITVMPPGNNLDSRISPVEALTWQDANGLRVIGVRCVLEEGDLEKLQDGAAVWLHFMEQVVPFSIVVDA